MLAELTTRKDGLVITTKVIQVTRGSESTVTYSIEVSTVDEGGFRTVLRHGEAMLPPDFVQALKLELWERLKP
jgi:hypothetical protein